MKSEHPVAVSELGDEFLQETVDAIRFVVGVGLTEVVVERDEDFGVFLFFSDGVVCGIVAVGVDGCPGIERAVCKGAGASGVKPFAVVDFVVNDEIGDASVAIFAVEIISQEACKAPVIGMFSVGGGAEDVGDDAPCGAASARPRGHAVDDGGNDDAVIRIVADGIGIGCIDREAIAVVQNLSRTARRRLRRLPFGPNEVHGDAVNFVADDLIAVLPIGLQAFDAFARRICVADGDGFVGANVVFAVLGVGA